MKHPQHASRDASQYARQRAWHVLVIGGASGSGKTSLSYRLAHYFGVGITEADDIHLAIMRMTTPEQQPILHRWETDPAARHWPPEKILEHFIKVCQQMAPAYEAVIANHLESDVPLVLEGDYLLPALAEQCDFGGYANQGRVRGLFIHEEDEEQFVRNYLQREPASGRQEGRARVSWLHSQWLVQQVAQVGGIVIPARPWATAFERILESLGKS
jgi:2-phosphoglycerate kinase